MEQELYTLDSKTRDLIPNSFAWSYRIIPQHATNDSYTFFYDETTDTFKKMPELEVLLGKKIKLIPKSHLFIEQNLSKNYLSDAGVNKTQSRTLSIQDKQFVNQLFQEAKRLKSSDIHIETYEQKCRVRLRIDGKLVERMSVSKSDFPALINKIKILAGLDISEKRLPQDGRIFFNHEDLKFDVRVSVIPTLYGEKIVLRLLGSDAKDIQLEHLGFSALDLERYKVSIKKPSGILLISGPTGSGKTTTLYGTLKVLNKETDNILTVEDPIEYTLEGINQVQVKEDIGLTFSSALRSFLRQDPDIIMVGEIRDFETATLAIRAALTGHLVLSTIHTNSAWGTIARLIDMGVPSFLLSNTLNISVAQRLVRTLCPKCKRKSEHPRQVKLNTGEILIINDHFVHQGCQECLFTGYKGRKAIYEVIPVDTVVSDLIAENRKDVSEYFKSIHVKTLGQSALDAVKNGDTSVEEIYPLLLNDQF